MESYGRIRDHVLYPTGSTPEGGFLLQQDGRPDTFPTAAEKVRNRLDPEATVGRARAVNAEILRQEQQAQAEERVRAQGQAIAPARRTSPRSSPATAVADRTAPRRAAQRISPRTAHQIAALQARGE